MTPEEEEYYRNKAYQLLAQDQEERRRIKYLARIDFAEALEYLARRVGLIWGDLKRIFGPLLYDDDEVSRW